MPDPDGALAPERLAASARHYCYDMLAALGERGRRVFEETLPGLRAGPFALLRDGDMYGSTMVALESLYPRLSPGGFVIIDDYGALPACRAAVEDYRAANAITAPLARLDWTGVRYLRLPLTGAVHAGQDLL